MKHFISKIQKGKNNGTNSGLSAESTTTPEVLPHSARKEIRKEAYLHVLPGHSRSTRNKSSLTSSRNSEKKISEKPRSSNPTKAVKIETTKNNNYETRRDIIPTGTRAGTGTGTSTGSASSSNNNPQPRDAINVNVNDANVSALQINPGLRIIRRRYVRQPVPVPGPGPGPARQPHVLIEFICNICGNRQSSLVALFEHIHDHTGFKPFLCHLCLKKYVRIECLRRHEKSHKKKGRDGSNHRKIGCPICNLKFSWSSGLYNHVRKIHKGIFSI